MMWSSSAGTAGLSSPGRTGAWRRMASKTSAGVLPVNGSPPVAISYSTIAERKEIAAPVELLATRLLGRHRGQRAHGVTGLGHPVRPQHARRLGELVGDVRQMRGQLRQPEVEYFHLAVIGDEDVRRLDVAVHDAGMMGSLEGVGDLTAEVEHHIDRQRSAVDPAAERAALEQLHHEKRQAVVLADVVHRADVRVIQRGRRARLALKSLGGDRILQQLRGEELDGDLASEAGVFGAIDHTHTALANLVDDSVMGDSLADHRRAKLPMVGRAVTAVKNSAPADHCCQD